MRKGEMPQAMEAFEVKLRKLKSGCLSGSRNGLRIVVQKVKGGFESTFSYKRRKAYSAMQFGRTPWDSLLNARSAFFQIKIPHDIWDEIDFIGIGEVSLS